MVSVGFGSVGEFLSVCLSGFTLLFVLHTSDARQRTFRVSAVIVAVAVATAAVGFLSGEEEGSVAAGLIGLLLAFAAPVIILLRIFHSPRITVRLVLGALAIYLLLGLTYAYLYPVIGVLTGEPFFVQTAEGRIDRLRLFQLRDPDDRRVRRLHGVHECGTDLRGLRGSHRAAVPGVGGRPARRQHRSDDLARRRAG